MQIGTVVTRKKIGELREHPQNRKYNTDISGVERIALTESIREFGVLQPIVITQAGIIISGHQRWKIAEELGHEEIKTVEFHGTEQEVLYFLVSENKARREQERDPIKKALQYQVLYEAWGIQHGGSRSSAQGERLNAIDLAESVGSSASNVRKYLRLLQLIEPLQQLVSAGAIGLTVGNRFAALSEEQQRQAHELITKQGLEEVKISECEEIFRLLKGEETQESGPIEESRSGQNASGKNKYAKVEKQLQKWWEDTPGDELEIFQELLLRYAEKRRA